MLAGVSQREVLAPQTNEVPLGPGGLLRQRAQGTPRARPPIVRVARVSQEFGGRLGATHALEIPFAFNTLDRPGVDGMLGPGPRPDALAQRMHAAWTSFVKTGDPACAETGAWSCYEPRAREVMEFGERVGALRDPGAATRALWDGAR